MSLASAPISAVIAILEEVSSSGHRQLPFRGTEVTVYLRFNFHSVHYFAFGSFSGPNFFSRECSEPLDHVCLANGPLKNKCIACVPPTELVTDDSPAGMCCQQENNRSTVKLVMKPHSVPTRT
jgi:hypothetical protein